jgi:hypothetical protein
MRLLPAFPTSAILVASLAIAVTLAPAQTPATRQGAPTTAGYGKLPLSFEANQGQTDPSVQFLAHGQGYTFVLSPGEAALSLRAAAPASTGQRTSLIRLHLAGADAHAIPQNEDPQVTKSNYFIGNDPAKWHTNISNYGRVRYRSVYPGIDLVYYGNQRQLEHDFIVAPHADPTAIQLAIAGTQTQRIDRQTGDLVLTTPAGTLRLLKPVTYQESRKAEGQRTQIASSYRLLKGNKVGFSVGQYNHAMPLIIDPILVYSTFLGGSGSTYNGGIYNGGTIPGNPGDSGNGIAIDSDGNAYVAGSTSSLDFPVTSGAYQTENSAVKAGNGATAFVAKFNATGSALVYSTFLGGSGESSLVLGQSGGESAQAVAIDSAGDVYVTGWTKSADFPVTSSAFQTVNKSFPNGTASGFVTKLNAAGDALLYSTYLGGTTTNPCHSLGLFAGNLYVPEQAGMAIAVDGQGSSYVAGTTSASDFPTTAGALQTTYPASGLKVHSGFVTKLSSDGASLAYSTYLGGSGSGTGCNALGDEAYALAIDSSGDAYVVGGTTSQDFPVTAGALQTVNTGGSNAFITELNPAGSAEIYSTYLGGSGGGDYATALAVDTSGNAYVGGSAGPGFPITTGVVFPTYGGAGFVSKLSAGGSALEYSTYVPGNSAIGGLAADNSGSVYVTGGTEGAPFPTTPDAVVQDTSSTPSDAFVAKLNPTATAVEFATLLGSPTGSPWSYGNALALDSAGNLYVTGIAAGNDFPITNGAFQTRNALASVGSAFGQGNAFVSKLALAGDTAGHTPTNITIAESSSLLNQGQPITLTAVVTGNTGTATPTGSVAFWVGANSYTAALNASGVATWTSTTLAPGAYSAAAYYQGDAAHLSSSIENGTPFRIVGPPAILTGSDDGGPDPTYPYGSTLYGLRAVVEDASGYGLGGVTVHFSGPGLTFSCPGGLCISGSDGFVFTFVTANAAGNLIATASVSGLSSTVTYPITITPGHLTVKLQSSSRQYGTTNPTLSYTVTGLLNGDTVTVTPSTTATLSSPVGNYPVTASVSGPAAANYTLTVQNGNLRVTAPTLTVWASPTTQGSNYGSPIALSTGFSLTGFVNGDTQATAVTGAPAQTTIATSTSPGGSYPINQSIGTLASTNYIFNLRGGRYYIYDVTLNLTATSFTIAQGQPIPTLTYSLTGFVNGDTQATAVTGAPSLSTTATSTSSPGTYPIVITQGSLASGHYRFHPVNGTLTITLPAAAFTFSPSSLTFPPTRVNTTTSEVLTVNNTSAYAASVRSYTFSGANASEFSIQSKSCVTTLAANSSCTLTIAFRPATTGTASASLIATDSATGSPQSVALSGTGN